MIGMQLPREREQRRLLKSLRDGGGYGIWMIVQRAGDVVFAASPVPKLAGYEIVCASPERLYDIWKDNHLITPQQTKEQIRKWLRENTPSWLYDDTPTTTEQAEIVMAWLEAFRERYPGLITVGDQ